MNSIHPLPLDVKQETLEAENRIRSYIRETPLVHSPSLSRKTGCAVYLKLENWQITRSFKLRGAFNKLLSVAEVARKKGIVTASSGNHGAATAHASKTLGIRAKIVLPESASPAKVETLLSYGVEIVQHGDDCILAEQHGRRLADVEDRIYIPPYNDAKIIGGQGTVGVEIERQTDKVDAVFVPVGGGGLIGGIAGYLKSLHPEIRIIGCQPEHSAVMAASVEAGRILDIASKPTISDGSAGGIESGSVTFDLCRTLVDEFILVSEEEITQSLLLILKNHHLIVEGSAVLSVASLLREAGRFEGKTVALILSGAKISLELLRFILNQGTNHG